MESKELMIGDWVIASRYEFVGDGGRYREWKEIGKVTRIYEDVATLIFPKIETPLFPAREDDWEEIELKDIEPIPLTHEILEKNGWVRLYYVDGYIEKYRGNMDIEQFRGQNSWTIFDGFVDIKYVHELQHALKLCGIDKEIIIE